MRIYHSIVRQIYGFKDSMSNTAQLTQEHWNAFVAQEHLSEQQETQFKRYMEMLIAWNESFNITAITHPMYIIPDHFCDSLRLGDFVDMKTIQGLGDIGTGGGFPGIPLKIKYPHLRIVLLEVNNKKIQFLNAVIQELGLTDIEVCSLDWRNFLRSTNFKLDMLCARASLQPEELVRMFNGSSPYRNAMLVYWASEKWQPDAKLVPLIVRDEPYQVEEKNRRLIFFTHSRDAN